MRSLQKWMMGLLLFAASVSVTAQMQHAKGGLARAELGSSAALDAQGRLWLVSKEAGGEDGKGQYLVVQMSADRGQTWTTPRRVLAKPEALSAEGENRPKLAFGAQGEMLITYTKPLRKPYTGEIRFVRSTDGGQTFSAPLTVHANRDEITHRFESMMVDPQGRIFIAWIDKRDAELARSRKEVYAGAAIYYAVSEDHGVSFQGDYKLADHSCECCRIALALNPAGKVVAMWRHVFDDNVRDHAMAELQADGQASALVRTTYDDWRVSACPHHGPSLAFDEDGKRHQTWFNVRAEQGGIYYASATKDGVLDELTVLGNAQAEHPDVLVQGRQIVIVWKQFDGKASAILGRVSSDRGLSWETRHYGQTLGHSDQAHLLATPTGMVVVWRTQLEGVRVLPAD